MSCIEEERLTHDKSRFPLLVCSILPQHLKSNTVTHTHTRTHTTHTHSRTYSIHTWYRYILCMHVILHHDHSPLPNWHTHCQHTLYCTDSQQKVINWYIIIMHVYILYFLWTITCTCSCTCTCTCILYLYMYMYPHQLFLRLKFPCPA